MQLHRYGNLEAGEFRVKITFKNAKDRTETIAAEQVYDIEKGEHFAIFVYFQNL